MAKINKIKLPDGVTYDVQDTVSGYVSTEATTSAKGLMSASDKTKLNGIASGAEVNQNAFSNIKVGSTTVAADTKTDTLEFVAGDNVILTPDATNDKITISSELPPTTKSVDNLPQPIASFSDGADAPLKSLTVSIEPQQAGSGDPSPTNVRPISGWSGVNVQVRPQNLFDYESASVFNAYIYIAQNLLASSATSRTVVFPCSPNKTYTIYHNITSVFRVATAREEITEQKLVNGVPLFGVQDIGSSLNTTTINTGANDLYLVIQLSATYFDYNIRQLRIEDEQTANTTTIPFVDGQGNPVEVYGGKIDVINGTSGNEKTLGFVNLGDLTWTKRTDYGEGSYFLSQELSDKLVGSYDMMCSHYKVVQNRNFITATSQIAPANNTNSKDLVVRDDRYSDADTFKNAVNGVQLVYELATPTTFYTHPTSIKSLDGENNVFASTGQIEELEYLTQPYTGITANLAGYAYESGKASIADTASSVAWTNVTEKPSTYTPASHTHGNIQNGGTLQTNDVTIASGDKLIVTDSSDSNKVARTSVSFDGSTATKCLTQKGTWESFSNNTGTVTSVKVGTTSYTPSSGVVSLPAYPTTLPASDVYSWAKASSKPSYSASDVGAIATTAKGAANGVAELDANGLVPSSQLPSYVDDVLEYSAKSSFPTTGETGKIYVDTSTNLTYRWSGTAYVEISPSLALGTTSSTAYRGDYGNTAYTHATDANRLTTAKTEGLYKIATTAEGHIKSVTAVAKSDITGLGIPGSDTNTHRPIQVNGTQILGDNTTALNLKAGGNVSVTNSSGTVTIAATDTKYTATTTSIGSASAGTAIAADDITAWSTNTPTSCTISQGVLTFTAGSAASLSYTARSIPNISVTSKTVATGITAS